MIYNFKIENRFFYSVLEGMGVTPYLQLFFSQHKSRVKDAFEKMLKEMKQEENSEYRTKFIKEMYFEQFYYAVKFTFAVLFAKDVVRLYQNHKNLELSKLSAHGLAKKMSNDAQNEVYIKQVEFVINKCCNSTLEAYKK